MTTLLQAIGKLSTGRDTFYHNLQDAIVVADEEKKNTDMSYYDAELQGNYLVFPNGSKQKVHKVVKKLMGSTYYEHVINARLELVTTARPEEVAKVKVVSGKSIIKYIHEDNYYNCNHSLGAVCIRRTEYIKSGRLDLYVDNARMIVAVDEEDKTLAFCFIWDCVNLANKAEKTIVLADRIYGCHPNFKKYLSTWVVTNDLVQHFINGNECNSKKTQVVKLKENIKTYPKLPFVDNFYNVTPDGEYLTRFEAPNLFSLHRSSGVDLTDFEDFRVKSMIFGVSYDRHGGTRFGYDVDDN
jgi:hypothetical protein